MNEAVYCQNLEGLLSWFRNGIPQFSVPTKTLQTMYPLTHSPLSTYLCGWLERRIGGTKGEGWGLIKETFTGSNNEIRKWTVTATVVSVRTKEMNGSQVTAHHTELGNV